MATINKNLEKLTKEDIIAISIRYLRGWYNLEKDYGIRLKGLNNKRRLFGFDEIDKNKAFEYKINYIKSHYSNQEIYDAILFVMKTVRLSEQRWSGIEVLDCRFDRDYVKAFRILIGSSEYRKLSEQNRVQKLMSTQIEKYGGVGLASTETFDKAVITNLQKYGVSNVMQSDDIKGKIISPFANEELRQKIIDEKARVRYEEFKIAMNTDFKNFKFDSNAEKLVFFKLISKFGKHDVYYQYGLHPYDKRYPFNCDFYIKSLDLFIELNSHYSHYNHWFDENNNVDILRRKNLLDSGKKHNVDAVKTWCETDLKKRSCAKFNNLNYLVFWDGSQTKLKNGCIINNLTDFYKWFDDYNCDTERFLQDFSGNTY